MLVFLLLSFYSQLRKVILLASAAEEGFTYNDSTYLPLYSNKPAETPYVQKWDIFCPCFLLIISLVLLIIGYVYYHSFLLFIEYSLQTNNNYTLLLFIINYSSRGLSWISQVLPRFHHHL